MPDQQLPETSPQVEPTPPALGNRQIGFDVARCIAFFGMVIVNYQILMGSRSGSGPEWLYKIYKACYGRAAATFVILAGVGLTLLYKAKKNPPAPSVGFKRVLSPLRPLLLVALLCSSWVAVDFYTAERDLGRSFGYGPVTWRRPTSASTTSASTRMGPRSQNKTYPVAPVQERFLDHLSAIKSGEFSTFLKIGMGFCSVMLLLFWVFARKFSTPQGILVKRSLFLFAFGYMWWPVWSFDILHFYGFYLLAGCIFLGLRSRWIWLALIGVLGGTFFRQFIYDATEVRDWRSSSWDGWEEALKNLFINGIHPVLPWFAFLLTGMLIGRLNTSKASTRFGILIAGVILATLGHMSAEPVEHWLYPEKYVVHGDESLELVVEDPEPQPKQRSNSRGISAGGGNRNASSRPSNRGSGRGRRPGSRGGDSRPTPAEHSSTNGTAASSNSPEQHGGTSAPTGGHGGQRGSNGSKDPDPLDMTIVEGFPKDKYADFLKDVEKVRVRLARQGRYKDRKIRVEEVEYSGQKRPAVILEVSYGKGKPAPSRHKRDLKSAISSLRRSIIYDQARFDAEKERWKERNEERKAKARRRAIAEGRDPDEKPKDVAKKPKTADSQPAGNNANSAPETATADGNAESSVTPTSQPTAATAQPTSNPTSTGASDSRNRFRGKVWPALVNLVGIERHLPVKDGDKQKLIPWDTSWVDAEAVAHPTAKQRLASMTTISSGSKSPYYMLTAIGTSMGIIGLCLILASFSRMKRILSPFVLTGQMALTLYVGHALVGFYILNWIDMRRGNPMPFVAFYVVMCWVTSVAFSVAWRAFFKRGPLEMVMRWMTG